jgi:outer membrane immunogenic protein
MLPVAPIAPALNWTGCYVGAHAGAAWGRRTVDTFDPSAGRPVLTDALAVPTPFYNLTAALASGSGAYSYDLAASGMGGGQLGCNWQPGNARWVFGAEAEGGVMRLSGSVINPYNINFTAADHIDTTTVGNWYGTFAARTGFTAGDMLFYAKGGVGFTHVEADSIDQCIGSGLLGGANPLCSTSILFARGSANPVFFVVGGGAEWMFAQNWSFKGEYLYMGLDTNFNVCGPGAGRQLATGLIFCANHNVDGIHTAKFGVNFKFM